MPQRHRWVGGWVGGWVGACPWRVPPVPDSSPQPHGTHLALHCSSCCSPPSPAAQEAAGIPAIAAVQSLLRSVTIPWGAKSTAFNVGLASNTEVTILRAHKQGLYMFQSPGNPQWQVRTLADANAQSAGNGCVWAKVAGEWGCGNCKCHADPQLRHIPAALAVHCSHPALQGFDLSKPATWAHLNGSIHKVPLNLGIDTWWHNLIPKGASK